MSSHMEPSATFKQNKTNTLGNDSWPVFSSVESASPSCRFRAKKKSVKISENLKQLRKQDVQLMRQFLKLHSMRIGGRGVRIFEDWKLQRDNE